MTQVTERAVLAGGCFWGVQDLIRKRPGVISTRVGYSGGEVANATYRNHGSHAEAVEIIFDPERESFRDLLEFFFQIHDPTTRNRQGNDVGASYRSVILYTDEEQRKIAEDTIADVDASGLWPGKVVTEVVPAGPFWEAEPEHQDYLLNYPNGYTCHFVRPNWKLPGEQRTPDRDEPGCRPDGHHGDGGSWCPPTMGASMRSQCRWPTCGERAVRGGRREQAPQAPEERAPRR